MIVPYIVNGADWWGGVDFFNNSAHSKILQIEIARSDGMVGKTIIESINSDNHYVLGPDDITGNDPNGRYTLFFNDGFSVTPFQGLGATGFGILPIVEGHRTKFNKTAMSFANKPYLNYAGNVSCCNLYEEHIHAVERVALDIYNDYPDRNSRVVNIGDACPIVGNCPNHPPGSHAGLYSFDVDYYTFKTNSTQYARPVDSMWLDAGMTLREGVFDVERNGEFLLRLMKIYPKLHARTNEVLRNLLFEYSSDLNGHLTGDIGATYNHYTHFHIDLTE